MSELTRKYLRHRKDDARIAYEAAKSAVYHLAAKLEDDEPVGRLRALIEKADAAGERWREASDVYIAFLDAEHASRVAEDAS